MTPSPLDLANERIRQLEESLEASKASSKRIKAEGQHIDYGKLLNRFNRQKDQNETYRNALIEITECGTLERAEFIATNALSNNK